MPLLTASDLDAARAASLTVPCPLPTCAAGVGHLCRYASRREDPETGEALRPIQPVWVARTAHLERVAAHTDGRLFGYTLRALEQDARKWELNVIQQRALYPGLSD